MSRIKGSEKTGGRKAGTPNRISGTVKEWLSGLIDRNREQIEADLKKLSPKERLQMLEKLMQYVVPKQQAVSAKVDFRKMSEEQLNRVINELTKEVENDYTD